MLVLCWLALQDRVSVPALVLVESMMEIFHMYTCTHVSSIRGLQYAHTAKQ